MPRHSICVPTGVSPGRLRFKSRHEAPKVKAWRCDLTALSRRYNLYFVACNEAIHVYRPSFPDQNVPSEPDLILDLPVSSTDLPYGIDYEDTHSVTRLYLDYLGHEEVLVATCDDGDVVGYRIEEIQRHLKDQERLSKSNADDDAVMAVRVFLHRNVGASAWGLSIHREARMIAISANTHQVTVLAYALANTESPAMGFENTLPTDDKDEDEGSDDFPSPRARDHVITLHAETNVPAVSFNNNGDDPNGRYLFSSSIDGKTMLWDLHNPDIPARIYQMGWCASASRPDKAPETHFANCLCLKPGNVPHGAWGAMFLDPQSAREVFEVDPKYTPNPPTRQAPHFEELGDSAKLFTEVGYNDFLSDDSDDSASLDETSDMGISDQLDDDDDDDDDDVEEDVNPSSDGMIGPDQMMIDSNSDSHSILEAGTGAIEGQDVPPNNNDTAVQEDSLFVPETDLQEASPMEEQLNNIASWFSNPSAEGLQSYSSDSDISASDDDLGISPSMLSAQLIPKRTRKAYCEIGHGGCADQAMIDKGPRGPCLIITKEEIFLLQWPIFSLIGTKILTMRRPLHLGGWAPYLVSHDRLCFSTQINELGIFIVASPTGRVGVFSLTKMKQPSAAKNKKYTYKYGFQLEYILPFHKHNDREVCQSAVAPGARLIGVAVGPVQGAFDQPAENEEPGDEFSTRSGRRWRLLMYFTDHTVLSYEISKNTAGQEPGVGDLVV